MKLKSIVVGTTFACLTALALTVNAQTDTSITTTTTTTDMSATRMAPPPPVNNKVYDAMVGTWRGESNMMGTKMNDVLTIGWQLNHQFIIMELEATNKNNPSEKYEGMGVMGVDAQGNAKTWWFDSWGAESVSTGTGQFSDNMLTMTDSNSKFNETRTFKINGNQMTMHAKGTMTMNGKQQAFDMTTIYRK